MNGITGEVCQNLYLLTTGDVTGILCPFLVQSCLCESEQSKTITISMRIDIGADNYYVYSKVQPAINQNIGEIVPLERTFPTKTASHWVANASGTGVIQGILTYTSGQRVRHSLPVKITSKLERHFFCISKTRRAKVHTIMGNSPYTENLGKGSRLPLRPSEIPQEQILLDFIVDPTSSFSRPRTEEKSSEDNGKLKNVNQKPCLRSHRTSDHGISSELSNELIPKQRRERQKLVAYYQDPRVATSAHIIDTEPHIQRVSSGISDQIFPASVPISISVAEAIASPQSRE